MMGWFGPSQGLAIADEFETIETPVDKICAWCAEGFADGDSGIRYIGGEVAHVECFMRQVFGGVNHQLHRCSCSFCGGSVSPDPPGVGRREAARVAWKLARTKGQG